MILCSLSAVPRWWRRNLAIFLHLLLSDFIQSCFSMNFSLLQTPPQFLAVVSMVAMEMCIVSSSVQSNSCFLILYLYILYYGGKIDRRAVEWQRFGDKNTNTSTCLTNGSITSSDSFFTLGQPFPVHLSGGRITSQSLLWSRVQ